MARTHGSTQYTRDQRNFVKDNWMNMSDDELSVSVGRSVSCIKKLRRSLGIRRYDFTLTENKTKAYICELYVSGKTIDQIQGVIGRSKNQIIYTITRCLSLIQLTDRAKVIILKSKI